MADALNVSNLRTALATSAAYPLLIKSPRAVGYHTISNVAVTASTTTDLYPATGGESANWFVITLTPLVPAGEAAGSFTGRPSSRLPDLTGVMTAGDFSALMTSLYNSYKVGIGDYYGIYLCEQPARVSIMTEYSTTNRVAAVLQLF